MLGNTSERIFGAFLQNWTRRSLYSLLRIFFRNDRVQSKLHQSEVKSIIIIPLGDAIGDLILATAVWRVIKSRIPNCKVGVITSPRNASLLISDPDVNATYTFAGRRDLGHISELLRARRDDYQIVLNLHSSHLTDYGFFANIMGPRAIKITANHPRRNMYEIFFNHIGKRDRHTIPLSTLSLELLSEVIEFEPPIKLAESWPSLVIPESGTEKVKENLAGTDDFILIQQQAATPFREWGIENSLELAKRFVIDYPRSSVFIVASPPMLTRLKAIVASANDSRICIFPTETLSELAALIKLAKVVVSPDTSIMHFASAMQTPIVVLLTDVENIPLEWLPVGTPSKLLAPGIRGAPVETITVKSVLESVEALYNREFSTSQTSLDVESTTHPMFQRENGQRLLREFSISINQTDSVPL